MSALPALPLPSPAPQPQTTSTVMTATIAGTKTPPKTNTLRSEPKWFYGKCRSRVLEVSDLTRFGGSSENPILPANSETSQIEFSQLLSRVETSLENRRTVHKPMVHRAGGGVLHNSPAVSNPMNQEEACTE